MCFTDADIVIVDKNVVISASNILRGGNHPQNKANIWWHTFINEPRYLINPFFAAFEISSQSIPTYEEFCDEHQRCCGVLRRAFPKARIVDYNAAAYQGAYALIEEITSGYEAEVAFLQAVAPLIAVRNPKYRLKKIEEALFDCARRFGLGRPTLSLLASLSCLYEGASKESSSPARPVLKPKSTYTKLEAHNAIMDLYALQLLIQSTAKINKKIALCTSDKGLLRFWCALKVKPGGTVTTDGFNFNMELSRAMFPSLDELAILDLQQRVKTYGF